jgi:signal transduction histidine kinase
MSRYICPFCEAAVDAQDLTCHNCGKLLPVAASQIEDAAQNTLRKQGKPITPEVLTPRLGDFMVEKGYITIEDLDAALMYQQGQALNGRAVLLGEALVGAGKLSRLELDEAITEQIFILQGALRTSNELLEQRVEERTHELSEALDKLTEINALKNNFISNISHELRTPLAHMVGYIDLFADGSMGELTGDQQMAMDVLKRANDRLFHLIDNLIQFSLIYKNEVAIEPEAVDIRTLVGGSLSRNQRLAETNQITLSMDLPEELPAVHGDPEKLGWVFDSLIDNGIKFNKPGGRVDVSSNLMNGGIELLVVDNGIGISQEQLGELFEPFHQLDGSSTRRYGGTGMGLALAYKIVEAHHSVIEVESKPGAGSIFRFRLPLAKKNA